ncbi:MAG: hypothetical protein IKT55_08780 [Clostridia bacterium]|nr:hypothetical protein [Clostridia bacterium]
MKKILAIVLAVVMCASLVVGVGAANINAMYSSYDYDDYDDYYDDYYYDDYYYDDYDDYYYDDYDDSYDTYGGSSDEEVIGIVAII